MQFNAYLAEVGDAKGGGRFIEEPDSVPNFVFQTRGGALEPYEEALAQALTSAFDAGAFEFRELVAALNANGSRTADGSEWAEPTLDAELDRLGQALFRPVSGGIAV